MPREIKGCLVKPIWEDAEPHRWLVFDEDTEFNFDYYASAMEAMVSGKPRGWYAYKEIEWLDFPHFVASPKSAAPAKQDLAFIKEIIDKTGQYATELSSANLRLYAYYR